MFQAMAKMQLKDAVKAAAEAFVELAKEHPEYTEQRQAGAEAPDGAAGAHEDMVEVLLRIEKELHASSHGPVRQGRQQGRNGGAARHEVIPQVR